MSAGSSCAPGHVWLVLASVACQWCHPAQAGRLEVNRFNVPGAIEGCWETLRFVEAFEEAPVVVALSTMQGPAPAKVRLRAITNHSFQTCITEPMPEDGEHDKMSITFMMASPGVHMLPDGRVFEAGIVETMQRQGASCRPLDFPNKGWEELAFAHSFSEIPAVLTDLQTANNEVSNQPSAPWLVVGVSSLTSSSMRVALDSVKAFDGQVNVPEQIGYIAFDTQASTTQIQVPAKRVCQVGQEILIRSWQGMFLQDQAGVLQVASNRDSSARWNTSLSNSKVIFTSHRSVQLSESSANEPILEAQQATAQEWTIEGADGGQVFLLSQTNRVLMTNGSGTLELHLQWSDFSWLQNFEVGVV
ncbi:unnamed protein product [Symbiodinium natans]|uniref:Uncharacterized protein n=1 Tax=Symbiodinium natans TaxID=878477 RepID=A0A812R6Q7_9DINO|nr:unnamed protein product [Symbiodinium natans]